MARRRSVLAVTGFATVAILAALAFMLGSAAVQLTAKPAPPTISSLATTNGVLAPSSDQVCTAADLAASLPYTMPRPQRLTSPVVFGPTPLLPAPDRGTLLVSAQEAWNIGAGSFSGGGGTVQLILAVDNSDMPATLGPGGLLDHYAKGTLVWVVHAHRVPVDFDGIPHPSLSGTTSSTTAPHPPCVFYDDTSIVSATTGEELDGTAY